MRSVERKVGVRVRSVDHRGSAVRREVQELAAIAADRDVRDDVELLPGFAERALEREVVARRDDQLSCGAPCARSTPASSASNRCTAPRLEVRVEERVELVVERAEPALHGDVLRDARQIMTVVGRITESTREVRGDIPLHQNPRVIESAAASCGTEHRDEPSAERRSNVSS